jgi:hypothetical protein
VNDANQVSAEKLVEIYKARDPLQGHLLISYLRENGMEAAFQGLPAVPLEAGQLLGTSDQIVGVYVLEHEAARARELVREFLGAESLEMAAAGKPHPDKERIAELRGALREERQTFDFLAWTAVAFLVALALLWAIWPEWLKTPSPAPFYRWTGVLLLAVAAVFAGNWINRQLRRR